MAGKTTYYSLAYFDFGDKLDLAINVQREMDRFTFIDSQIYGLYSIFGNGVISGWTVSYNGNENGITLAVSPGIGIVNYISAQTSKVKYVESVDANSSLNVYAVPSGTSIIDRTIDFVAAVSAPSTISIKIASVVTTETGVSSIDNTDRTEISYHDFVVSEINSHKHRGTPTKIDLTREVKNQLSGARIGEISASKIFSGRFDDDRIPSLDHNNLEHRGVLSHSQLETFQQSLSSNDIIGLIPAINFLNECVFLKTEFPAFDSEFVNQINFVPGKSSNDIIDFYNTTAFVDLDEYRIIGLPDYDDINVFFTQPIRISSVPSKMLFVSSQYVPAGASISYGYTLSSSNDFNDYQLITRDEIIDIVDDSLSNAIYFRIGIRLDTSISDALEDVVYFGFSNETDSNDDFHFRIRFYSDEDRTNLVTTAASLTNQDRWDYEVEEGTISSIPAGGVNMDVGDTVTLIYTPDASLFSSYTTYYLIIDVWDGTSYSRLNESLKFISLSYGSPEPEDFLPYVNSFALLLEFEDDSKIKLYELY